MTRLFAAVVLAAMSGKAAEQHLMEGAAQSTVQVLIYEDLQCPDCADFRIMLDQQLLPRYAATVRFEHRDFPLAKHAWARKAAKTISSTGKLVESIPRIMRLAPCWAVVF